MLNLVARVAHVIAKSGGLVAKLVSEAEAFVVTYSPFKVSS